MNTKEDESKKQAKPPSAWVEHVQAYARENGLTYKDSLKACKGWKAVKQEQC